MTVTWTELAVRDLAEARSYIADRNVVAAASLGRRVLAAVAVLSDFPEAGRAGRRQGTRELGVAGTPYLLVYRTGQHGVVILRVLHGHRQWPPGRR